MVAKQMLPLFTDYHHLTDPNEYTTKKFIAVLKAFEIEGKLAKIDVNAEPREAWGTLEKENEEIYIILFDIHSQVTEGYFILGFTEGYRMWKLNSKNIE